MKKITHYRCFTDKNRNELVVKCRMLYGNDDTSLQNIKQPEAGFNDCR